MSNSIFVCGIGAMAALTVWQIVSSFLSGRIWVGSPGLFASSSSAWIERKLQPLAFFGAIVFYTLLSALLVAQAVHMAGIVQFDPFLWVSGAYRKSAMWVGQLR